jgi:spermidine synthase
MVVSAMIIPPQQPQVFEHSMGRLRLVLLLIGLTATVAQILLMRELLVVFYGNEISLGLLLVSWLWWTSRGSSLFGRKTLWLDDARPVLAGLQTLLAVTLPLTILAVRSARGVFITVPGEMLGPWPMLLTALVVLCPLCLLTGGAFSVGSRLVGQVTAAPLAIATGSVYLLEAIGSGIGGLAASLVLARQYTSFQVAFMVGMLNLLAAASLIVHRPLWRRVAYCSVLAVFAAGVLPFGAPRMEKLSLGRLWRGFHLLDSRNSAYGNLAVVQTGNSRTLLENGLVLFTVPDPQAAEEAVHYALLQHPAPRSVLLIGGGLNGSVTEMLKHPQIERVDIIELDPKIFELGRTYFAEQMSTLQDNARVRLYIDDGRLFLKSTSERFDVIILNLPEPQTAQINRFYTVEFFREAAARLNSGGILSFQLAASENYITPTRASFLKCIHRSLREVFPEVGTIPGDTVHFFAAMQPDAITDQPDELLQRLKSRHLETSYVREYYLPFRMSPDRMSDLATQIRPEPETPVNHDFVPIAYYFDVALWSTQFNVRYREAFANMARIPFSWIVWGPSALLVTGMVLAGVGRRRQFQHASVAACVGAMGFTLMALEVLLLLGFQAIYGYVYQQLALLVAAVMVGMALGSWLGLRRIGQEGGGDQRVTLRAVVSIQVVAALAPMLLFGFFLVCARSGSPAGFFVVSEIAFPIVALLCGMLGGYQFPLASSLFLDGRNNGPQNTGTLYAIDLLGACLGALVLSAYLVPVFGFLKTTMLILVLNLATALLAFTVGLREKMFPE